MIRIAFLLLMSVSVISLNVNANCQFDADMADDPNFIAKMKECEQKTLKLYDLPFSKKTTEALYEKDTTVDGQGIQERRIVAAGTLNHHGGNRYIAREHYSLLANAKFEETVIFAMQKLHGQMAQYCSKGWQKDAEWSEPLAGQAGHYYLHYQFVCKNTKN